MAIYITATGLHTPKDKITNEELVAAFNTYVDNYNAENAAAIESGEKVALQHSSAEFIEKASGIKSRYVIDKKGILDPKIMAPIFPARKLGEELSIMAEMGVDALQKTLDNAGLKADDLDGIICACSNFQRVYPAIAIEIQHAIGMTHGFAYDTNVACSAATFGIAGAVGSIKAGLGKRIAVVNVEITSAHLNWRNRDSHFIFGDVATATIIEELDTPKGYEILDSKLWTQFSTNIKNEFGFMDRSEFLAANSGMYPDLQEPVTDKLFLQEGRKVFREVCPKVSEIISTHLAENNIDTKNVKKLWLHQANINMIDLILRTVMGKDADKSIAPIVIDEFGNTSSASPIIAFHLKQDGIESGDLAVICSFGAGYSIGSVIVKKV
ncbi:beta-ketoacyl-ACP synthase III [Moraxella caviae]|uniref:3-oxoacyl-[acyl-carrier-protein] synthase 3 n=1 Tax=Moraxella caviae TaxID=34060 RepID=A0A1T0A320_9GAMM|nr:beta-ketoacyl-ACP synthase III [Moraxella caviae]OOR90085.1 beta-ketoacyl-ACP synthase III [Moraxella caviae]STZ14702.1 3-oxoacyl-[acyl-carrier-protein] synthase 3 [Moraxella caviae]VEW12870.1 3-oxoacyl-[acyl-carrier-protein] synthase 3 [Moraxella caviae]